jgi:hypothetical protein
MIIDEIGYETPFSFSRAFKRYAGISPKKYREWQTQARATQYPRSGAPRTPEHGLADGAGGLIACTRRTPAPSPAVP